MSDGVVEPSDVTMIGHSVGAQVAAQVGKELFRETGLKLGRIDALDPAALMYSYTASDKAKEGWNPRILNKKKIHKHDRSRFFSEVYETMRNRFWVTERNRFLKPIIIENRPCLRFCVTERNREPTSVTFV